MAASSAETWAGTVGRGRPRWHRFGPEVVRYLLLLLFLGVFFVPFIWIWLSALKSSREIARSPFGLPSEWLWSNLADAWTVGRFDRYIWNSVIYCVAIVGGVVLLSCLAGYALALLPLPGRNALLILFLLGLTVPFQSVMIPLYYLLQDVS